MPLDSEIFAKHREKEVKKREKSGKIGKKRKNLKEKAESGKVLSLYLPPPGLATLLVPMLSKPLFMYKYVF